MLKKIALAVLLLPSSSYAITREERKKELEVRLEEIIAEIAEFNAILYTIWPVLIFRMSKEDAAKIQNEMTEKSEELEALNKEYQLL